MCHAVGAGGPWEARGPLTALTGEASGFTLTQTLGRDFGLLHFLFSPFFFFKLARGITDKTARYLMST